MYCKVDEDTVSRIPGESAQFHEMTSLDKIPAIIETNANSTQRYGIHVDRSKSEDDTTVFT